MEKFDVAIVGSGACGGWACMTLAQSGFKVVLLEAGSHIDTYKEFRHRWPYEIPFRGAGQPGLLRKYFKGSTEYNYRIMIDDRENPYTTSPDTRFSWRRSRVLGGRTLHWSRASDRMSDLEFKAASRDGYGEDWPISYADLAPYYDRVEQFIGVSAARANLAQFPDGSFLPPDAAQLRGDAFFRRPVRRPASRRHRAASRSSPRCCTTGRPATTAAIASTAVMWAPCSAR